MGEADMKALDLVTLIILIIAGLDWLLVGLFSWSLIGTVFGFSAVVIKIVQIIVGLSALYQLLPLSRQMATA
jgi:uncharacterized membrane protein YuzA (DUF378 family)